MYLLETEFTDPRLQHLKKELLAHDERVQQLARENREAKVQPRLVRLGSQYGTKSALRAKLLLPLSRRGRKLVRAHPELAAALKVPHKNASVDEIADAAERNADALTPHLKMLIAANYPRNCLALLRREARALRAGAEKVARARQLLGRSNRDLTEQLSLARATINEFDAVLKMLPDYSRYKKRWTFATRLGARKGRPSKRRLAARERATARARARDD